MKTKIYMGGKITGDENFMEKFGSYEESLKMRGYIVLNPALLPFGMGYEDYMNICYAMIDVANEVWLLPDWLQSSGAKRERLYALSKKKIVKYLDSNHTVHDCLIDALKES